MWNNSSSRQEARRSTGSESINRGSCGRSWFMSAPLGIIRRAACGNGTDLGAGNHPHGRSTPKRPCGHAVLVPLSIKGGTNSGSDPTRTLLMELAGNAAADSICCLVRRGSFG